MAKKKAASSTQQQRRAAKTTRQHEDLASNDDASAQPMKSYIVLRSSLPAGSFIPAVLLQVLAVAYCILLLHGRPSSLLHISALLRPLMYETKTAMLKTIAGLLLVQLYFAIQLKLWSDRSQKKPEVQSPITEVQQQEPAQEELLPTSPEAEVLPLHRMLLKVDLSRLDLPSVPETLAGLVTMSIAIFLLAILMGAPVARLVPETFLFACYLSVLALTAPLHVLRSPFSRQPGKASVRSSWSRLFASFRPRSDIEIALLLPAYGAIVGSMLGVIPEGLDWEEPWQKWPVPCLLGSLTGWTIGQLATLGMCSILWLARAGSQKRIARDSARSDAVSKTE